MTQPPDDQSTTRFPKIVADTSGLIDDAAAASASGAVWKLDIADRDLDSNVIALPPHGAIQFHQGPELGVLIHVIAGSGELITDQDTLMLTPGVVVWLPAQSSRQFTAGPDGLRYLTVHQRKPGLQIGPPRK